MIILPQVDGNHEMCEHQLTLYLTLCIHNIYDLLLQPLHAV